MSLTIWRLLEYFSVDELKLVLSTIGESQTGNRTDLIERVVIEWPDHNKQSYHLLSYLDAPTLRRICNDYDLGKTGNRDILTRRIKKELDDNVSLKQKKNQNPTTSPFHVPHNKRDWGKIGVIIALLIGIPSLIFSSPMDFTFTNEPVPEDIVKDTNEGKHVLYENGKLTIDDFRVVETDPNDLVAATVSVGFQVPKWETKIVSDTPCEYQITSYETKAHFNPTKSWIDLEKANKAGIANILNHEQGHFDIQQIYAKIINTEINSEIVNHNFPCPDVDANELDSAVHQDAMNRLGSIESIFQNYTNISEDAYEDETTPGNNIDKQKMQIIWDKKIAACLSYDIREELQVCIELNEFKLE